jgi:hypothetical protein
MVKKRDLKSSLAAAARMLGAKGGRRGGPARDRALTKAQKQEIAAKGGRAKAAQDKGGA